MTPADHLAPTARSARSARRVAFRVAFAYMFAGLAWILVSDYLVKLVPGPLAAQLELVKGSLFVIATAGLLWLIIVRWAGRYAAQVDVTAGAELRFEQVMRMVPVGIVLADRKGRVEFLNPTAELMLGVESASVAGRDLTDVVTPLETTLFTIDELMRVGCVNGLEMRGAGEGASAVLVACGARLESADGSHEWVIALTDVTDTYRENQRTIRLVNRQKLFAAVCAAAVEDGVFAAAWVVAQDAETGRLRTVVSAGLTAEALREAEELLEGPPPDTTRRAWTVPPEGDLYVANDLRHSSRDPLRELARESGFGSSATFRIGEPQAPVVALTLFCAQAGFFDQEQIRLVGTLREATAFALDKLELETKRLDAEESLARSEAAYREIFVKHPEPMWVYDRASLRFLAVNDAAVRKYGYSHEEFAVMTIIDIRPPAELGSILNAVAHRTPGVPAEGYWTHVDKAGRAFTVHVHSNSVTWKGADAQLVLVQEVPVLD